MHMCMHMWQALQDKRDKPRPRVGGHAMLVARLHCGALKAEAQTRTECIEVTTCIWVHGC